MTRSERLSVPDEQEGNVSRIRRLGLVAIMAVALLVGGTPAFATEPLTTEGHVTDPETVRLV